MKAPFTTTTVCAATILASAVAASSANAIDFSKANPFSWFKEKEQTAPNVQQQTAQEATATAMMRDAKTAISTGNNGRASDIYKEIVQRYPFTIAAADAQMEHAGILRSNAKLQDAFDAYQKFITNYRNSPRFAEAVQHQYEIAEQSRTGKHSTIMLVIPAKIGSNDVVKMYEQVIKNAPFTKYAPLAEFAIGEIYQDKGEKALADAAFQTVVDNYPNTPQASEAQFRIGAISNAAAKKTQDAQNLVKARDALEVYKATHPTGDRITEVDAEKKQNTDISAERSFSIGQFYEKSKKPKAAAIYYNEAMKFGSDAASLKARERLAVLAAAFPEEMKENLAIEATDYTVPAAMNLKNRDEYAGPPAPELAKLGKKTKMRVERDDFKPIPLREPELPTRPSGPASPGMLIPPVSAEPKPADLPIPPAPGMSAPNGPAAPVVPPKPEEKKPASN